MYKKELFKSEHLYGHILKYLYDSPDTRFDFNKLNEHFKKDKEYLQTQLDWLELDKLIVKENNETAGVIYRISHDGFVFIRKLVDSQKSVDQANTAIVISAIAAALSLFGLFMNPATIVSHTETKNEVNVNSLNEGKNNTIIDTNTHIPKKKKGENIK